jgi:hypothetical protein
MTSPIAALTPPIPASSVPAHERTSPALLSRGTVVQRGTCAWLATRAGLTNGTTIRIMCCQCHSGTESPIFR